MGKRREGERGGEEEGVGKRDRGDEERQRETRGE